MSSMKASAKLILKALGKYIRDGWHIVGISLVLLVALDIVVGQALAIRDWYRSPSVRAAQIPHPQKDAFWYTEWDRNG